MAKTTLIVIIAVALFSVSYCNGLHNYNTLHVMHVIQWTTTILYITADCCESWICTNGQFYQLHQPNRTVCWMCCSTEWCSKCWPVSTSVLRWSTTQKHHLWQHRRGEMWHQVPLDHQTIWCITGDKTQHGVLLHRLCNFPQYLPIQWNEHNIWSRSSSNTRGGTQSFACKFNCYF